MSMPDPRYLGQYLTLLPTLFFVVVADLAKYVRYSFITDLTVSVIKRLRNKHSIQDKYLPSSQWAQDIQVNGGGMGRGDKLFMT